MKLALINAYPRADEERRPVSCEQSLRDFFDNSQIVSEIVNFPVAELGTPQGTPEISDFDGFILSGSPAGVYELHDWMKPYRSLITDIVESGKKIIAICFGHQLLADTLGGEGQRALVGWMLGPNQFEIKAQFDFMEPELESPYFLFSNRDQVVTLPLGAELIAGSQDCPNGMYTVGNQILAMQFHPEFTTQIMIDRIENFSYDVSPEWLEDMAHRTETINTSNAAIRSWIDNFLE